MPFAVRKAGLRLGFPGLPHHLEQGAAPLTPSLVVTGPPVHLALAQDLMWTSPAHQGNWGFKMAKPLGHWRVF